MLQKLWLIILIILPINSHAMWVSDTDKQYEKLDPLTYSAVLKNRQLIDQGPDSDRDAIAISSLQSIIAKHPNFAPAYVQLARATVDSGFISGDDYDPDTLNTGKEYLNKALALEPKYDYALAMMGFMFIMQNKPSEAESYYQQLLAMHSSYPYIYDQLSSLERHRGNFDKALEYTKLAQTTYMASPDAAPNQSAMLNDRLATLELQRGNRGKAIEYLKQGYSENKNNAKIASNYAAKIINAYRYGSLEDIDNLELEKWYKIGVQLAHAINTRSNSAWSWGDYASFELYYLGDYEKAIEYSQKALSIMNYGNARETLALAYYVKWAFLKSKNANNREANIFLHKAENLSPLTNENIQLLSYWSRGRYNVIQHILESKLAEQNSN